MEPLKLIIKSKKEKNYKLFMPLKVDFHLIYCVGITLQSYSVNNIQLYTTETVAKTESNMRRIADAA